MAMREVLEASTAIERAVQLGELFLSVPTEGGPTLLVDLQADVAAADRIIHTFEEDRR